MKQRVLLSAVVFMFLTLGFGPMVNARSRGPEPWSMPNVGPTQLSIPSVDLVAEIVPVGYELTNDTLSWQTDDDAVGWHRTSAMPGNLGNAVMSGHNASLGSGVFRDLHKVKIGDLITVTVNGAQVEYFVTDRVIFQYLWTSAERKAENGAWLGYFGDERLTLMTCYPWYTNTHRLVVVAHPVDPHSDRGAE